MYNRLNILGYGGNALGWAEGLGLWTADFTKLPDFEIEQISTLSFDMPVWESAKQGFVFAEDDDFAGDASTSGALLLDGQTVQTRTEIAGDSDWLALDGQAGQTITINLDYFTGGSDNFTATLRDADGNAVAGGANQNTITHTFAAAGQFFLDLSAGSIGNFHVYAHDHQDDFAGDISTTGTIADGESVSGVYHEGIGFDYNEDWFAFTLQAGQSVDFRALIPHAFNHMDFLVYDANGNPLFFDVQGRNFSTNEYFNIFTASQTGTFYVATASSAVGRAYTFSARVFTDDFADSVLASSGFGALNVNGGSATGIFESEGDIDVFAITVTQGSPFVINLIMDDPSQGGVLLNIFDEAGNLLLSDLTQGGIQTLLLGPESSGVYYVMVDAGFDAAGGYTVSAALIPDDYLEGTATTALLNVGQVISGHSDFVNDRDTFAITVEAGQVIRIDGAHGGDSSGFIVEFRDAAGTLVEAGFSTFNFLTQLYQFDVAGTYYFTVLIESVNPSDPIPYSFIATALPTFVLPDAVATIFPADYLSWAPLPNLGATPTAAPSSAQFISSGTHVVANGVTHYISRDNPGVDDTLFFLENDAVLENHGSLWIEAFGVEGAVAVRAGPETIVENFGTITAISNLSASGVSDGFLQNYGALTVISNREFAQGFAAGNVDVSTFTGAVPFLNTGTLSVWSGHKNALGIHVRNVFNPTVENQGTIAVTGFTESIGIDIGGGTVINSGTITIIAGQSFAGIGIYNNHADVTITNSGLIDAEFAVFSRGTAIMINSGAIIGDVVLIEEEGSPNLVQSLTNTGNIFGHVTLGAFNDVFDNTDGGFVAGFVNMGAGVDLARGGEFDDRLYGGADNDTLLGNGGDDYLRGGAGNDTLRGGLGDDVLVGGLGNDKLTGHAGADVFVISLGEGNDTITDFENGIDRLEIGDLAYSFNALKIVQFGADTIIYTGSATITLQNTQASDIDASDFSFRMFSSAPPRFDKRAVDVELEVSDVAAFLTDLAEGNSPDTAALQERQAHVEGFDDTPVYDAHDLF